MHALDYVIPIVARRAMTMEGFQNDPIVFWHYDWGSQPYVQVRREMNLEAPDAAWYGFIDEPPRLRA
jgi:D-alanyl-D-alanine dipeptidase